MYIISTHYSIPVYFFVSATRTRRYWLHFSYKIWFLLFVSLQFQKDKFKITIHVTSLTQFLTEINKKLFKEIKKFPSYSISKIELILLFIRHNLYILYIYMLSRSEYFHSTLTGHWYKTNHWLRYICTQLLVFSLVLFIPNLNYLLIICFTIFVYCCYTFFNLLFFNVCNNVFIC